MDKSRVMNSEGILPVLKNILRHTEFILSYSDITVFLLAVFVSSVLAIGLLLQNPVISFMIIAYGLGIGLVAGNMAQNLVEELSSGRVQLYLMMGLTRKRYALSWMLAVVVYPCIAVFLALSIPIILIDPTLFAKPTPILGLYAPMPIFNELFTAFILTTITAGLSALLPAITITKRSATVGIPVLVTLAYPFVAGFIGAILNLEPRSIAILVSPGNTIFAMMINDFSLDVIVALPQAIFIVILLASYVYMAGRREV